jgi:hypothetical protein
MLDTDDTSNKNCPSTNKPIESHNQDGVVMAGVVETQMMRTMSHLIMNTLQMKTHHTLLIMRIWMMMMMDRAM